MRRLKARARNPTWLVAAAGLASCLLSGGCRHLGYTSVGDGIYISNPIPQLEKAAKEVSAARVEAQGKNQGQSSPAEAPGDGRLDLAISINPGAGLGPEDFRILVDGKSVSVEGGGPAGALYGGLEVSARMRDGLPRADLPVPHARPRFPRRILRSALPLPGTILQPAGAQCPWEEFLDQVARARFNFLVAPCGHVFPHLVRLTRFPKAFDVPAAEAAVRVKAFREFLALAQARNVQCLLLLTDLRIPDSFLRSYGPADRRAADPSLLASYLKECVSELLKAYPALGGVGLTPEALSSMPQISAEKLMSGVLIDGIKASGRSARLFLEAGLGAGAERAAERPGVELVREVELEPALLLGPGPLEAPAAGGKAAAVRCGRIPWRLLGPGLPSLERSASILQRAAALTPEGFALSLYSPSSLSEVNRDLFERESLAAACFGLTAFEPGLDERSWRSMSSSLFGASGELLLAAAESASAVLSELATFKRSEAQWSPYTCREEPVKNRRALDLRDDTPFVSVLELAFSHAADPQRASIAEFVAGEMRPEGHGASRRAPQVTADAILAASASCLESLRGLPAGLAGAGPDPVAARARGAAKELEAVAYLGDFHARRIRAGLSLLRHVAGVREEGRSEARVEMERAAASWKQAEAAFRELRSRYQAPELFPDLSPRRADVESDLRTIAEARSDPSGFRFSPLFSAPLPLAADFDFNCLRGILHLGTSLLDYPPHSFSEVGQIFEAEDFGGTWSLLGDVPGYSGTGYLSSGLLGRQAELPLTLRILVERPGAVHVWLRALLGGGEGSPALRLRAGGRELGSSHGNASGPRRLAWAKVGQLQLAPGELFLQIADDGPGREGADALVITADRGWTPPSS